MTSILIALYAIATLADHISTNIVLKRGGYERNQFLAAIIAKWGSAGLFVAKAALFGIVLGYHAIVAPLADWVWMAGSLAFLVIVAANVRVLLRQ